nr:glycosyltransferase [Mesorhizobium delmotii]
MHTYWYARALAERGHQCHVVTNARDVETNFRLFMQEEDWARCECSFENGGHVRVHWAEMTQRESLHIPQTSMAVTRLAGNAISVVEEFDIQCLFSYYFEPYSVAGWIASKVTSLPHIIKHAGSDIGRIAKVPITRKVYMAALREADVIVSRGQVKSELENEGIDNKRFWTRDSFKVPAIFCSTAPALDVIELSEQARRSTEYSDRVFGSLLSAGPIIGAYGKLGERKGTFSLLESAALLRSQGIDFSIAVLGSSFMDRDQRFRGLISELGLSDRVLQLPFIPHWRVPEFIRTCRCVVFLENNFPIKHHAPTIPREVLACGIPLVCSEEVLVRQPFSRLLVDNVNCISIANVTDAAELAKRLAEALADAPRLTAIGVAGRRVSELHESQIDFPGNYESLFQGVVEGDDKRRGKSIGSGDSSTGPADDLAAGTAESVARHRLYRCPERYASIVRGGNLGPLWIPCIDTGIEWDDNTIVSGIASSGGGRFRVQVSNGIRDILGLVDGKRSVSEICDLLSERTKHTSDRVRNAIHDLFLEGLIKFIV